MTKKENLNSIGGFLESSGYNYCIYDLSRQVTALSIADFNRIEEQTIVYPYPYRKNMQFGLLFWQPEQITNPVIWFLSFPIDALGYMELASKDHFLNQLFTQIGEKISAQVTQQALHDHLSESSFAFKPSQEKMAMFHALATQHLQLPPSHYYAATRDYLSGAVGYDQWQFLGLQGLADVIARLDDDDNQTHIANSLAHLPEVPFTNLVQLLENAEPNTILSQTLAERLDTLSTLDNPSITQISVLVRALSNSTDKSLRNTSYLKLMASPHGQNIEVLAAIAGRAWQALQTPHLLTTYIQQLANSQTQSVFNTLLDDIIPLPAMRPLIMTAFKQSQDPVVNQKVTLYMERFTT